MRCPGRCRYFRLADHGTDIPFRLQKTNLKRITAHVVAAFPSLDGFEQRLSIELYRQLAAGRPVPRITLAENLSVDLSIVDRVLESWPGVFADEQRRIVGYWGLSVPSAYSSSHTLTLGERQLTAWCAWDTLFLPQSLGMSALVKSASPDGNYSVSLNVTAERVERVEPPGATMSFLLPDCMSLQSDVVTSFCHFIYFFPSRETGDAWVERNSGTFLLSIEDAYEIARLKNQMQYPEIFQGATLGGGELTS